MSGVERLARISLNAADPEALAAFYVDVLGFERVGASVQLGGLRVDLRPGRGRYPADVAGWSPLFQHFAIVVSDIDAAMQALHASNAWSPISTNGPQHLPANTGGVTAFKFRDPEGHPLELLAFPSAARGKTFERIDHSAISVADVDRSIAFCEGLGMKVGGRSLNVGPEQQRLDGIVDACVDVVGVAPTGAATPHVELLCYRGAHDRSMPMPAIDDIAATRLVFTVADVDALAGIAGLHADRIVERSADSLLLRDPDGHLLAFVVEGPE